MRRSLLLAALVAVPRLFAQAPAEIVNAADVITASDIARHISIIADDSMLGRDTPSRGLESTAQYIASQFQTLGLKPAGEAGTWFQRYRVPARVDFTQSRIVFSAGEKTATAVFTSGARLVSRTVPQKPFETSIALVTGRHTPESLERAKLRGKTILYIAPAKPDTANWNKMKGWFEQAASGLIVLTAEDSASFSRRVRTGMERPEVQYADRWAIVVRPEAVTGLRDLLAAAGVDLTEARTNSAATARELPGAKVSLEMQLDRTATDTTTAPNVVGVIQGSDSTLKDEFVLISAHMDHTGLSRGRTDSINNGADDNASGIAGLIELAKAYSQPGARPRRSIAFVAVSGGAKELWGARHFTAQLQSAQTLATLLGSIGMSSGGKGDTGDGDLGILRLLFGGGNTAVAPGQSPSVQITRVVANITLDMIGRNAQDTVFLNGPGDVNLETPPMWIAAAHPELGLTVVDDGTATIPGSDHLAFIQQGIPSLFLHSSDHHDDSPDTVDTNHAARVTRLAFYIGQKIANADQKPRWTTDGRRRYLQTLAE